VTATIGEGFLHELERICGSGGIVRERLQLLTYETDADGESYVAVDEGVLVKSGPDVMISVRNAIAGTDLRQLRETVEREFLTLDEQEQSLRSVMVKLESSFMRRLADFRHA